MRIDEYVRQDALGLAALVAGGEVSAEELLELAIRRVEALNPRYNAVVARWYDDARARIAAGLPAGPFRGVPFLLKDNMPYTGTTLSYGSVCLRDLPSEGTHPLAQRFDAAGLVAFGRTNMSEMGLMPNSISALHGATRNPWSIEHCPAGSSGGAAAAVACSMVPMAHGGDGGGSIRIPASACGVLGLKTSRGRLPEDTHYEPHGIVSQLCLSRSVRDTAALLDACHGARRGERFTPPPPPRPYAEAAASPPPPLRIAYLTRDLRDRPIHPDCLAAVQDAAELCVALGHTVTPVDSPIDGERFSEAFRVLWCTIPLYTLRQIQRQLRQVVPAPLSALVDNRYAALAAVYLRSLPLRRAPFTWQTRLVAREGRGMDTADLWLAYNELRDQALTLEAFLQGYDLLLTPTTGEPPRLLSSWQQRLNTRALEEQLDRFVAFTPLCNATGNPAISVPLYWNTEALPIGAHFMGRYGEEHTLLALAGQLEQTRPWADRWLDAHPEQQG